MLTFSRENIRDVRVWWNMWGISKYILFTCKGEKERGEKVEPIGVLRLFASCCDDETFYVSCEKGADNAMCDLNNRQIRALYRCPESIQIKSNTGGNIKVRYSNTEI